MEIIQGHIMAALSPLMALSMSVVAFLPAMVAGIVLLLVGALAAHWLRVLVERVLKMLTIDEVSHRAGVSAVLARLGMGTSLIHLIGVVVHTTLIVAFLLASANAFGLGIVPEYLRRVVGFLPTLMAVVLVLGGGLFLGDLTGGIVRRAADANHVRGSEALMRITHGLLVLFSGLIALEILGIDIRIFLDSMPIIVGAVGLGCAIAFGVAFGMAGRDTAERFIRDITPRSATKAEVNGSARMRVVR
jgi:hypothetical protein